MKSSQTRSHRDIIQGSEQPEPVQELLQLAAARLLPLERTVAVFEQSPEGRQAILRRSNSVEIAPRSDVQDLRQAIPMLGEQVVRPILWESLLRQVLPTLEEHGVDGERWLGQTRAAAELAIRLHDRLFPRGLIDVGELQDSLWLRDLGKVVLLCHPEVAYGRVLAQAHLSQQPLVEVERENLGFTHADIAGALAKVEGLGERLTVCLSERYSPHRAPLPHLPYVALMHLADVLAWRRVSSDGFGGGAPPLEQRLFERLGIQGEALDKLLARVRG